MREIIFRGKRVDNGEWIYGGWFSVDHENYIITNCDNVPVFDLWNFAEEVIPETVGQFTGLTDNKNGKKIFEGDIIKQTFRIGKNTREVISVIEYGIDLRAYCVCQRFSDGSGKTSLTVQSETGFVDCEIIGNIHDNPELLGE